MALGSFSCTSCCPDGLGFCLGLAKSSGILQQSSEHLLGWRQGPVPCPWTRGFISAAASDLLETSYPGPGLHGHASCPGPKAALAKENSSLAGGVGGGCTSHISTPTRTKIGCLHSAWGCLFANIALATVLLPLGQQRLSVCLPRPSWAPSLASTGASQPCVRISLLSPIAPHCGPMWSQQPDRCTLNLCVSLPLNT